MNLKKFFSELNIVSQCKKYNLPLWQCPQFLFLIIGLVDIVLIFLAYALANRYLQDPAVAALIVLILAALLFVLDFIIEKSIERLAEVNVMQSEFISIVSHQLRTPLSCAKWAMELLLSGKVGEVKKEQREYFEITKENLDQMQNLLSRLVLISKIESGKLKPKKEMILLEEITKKVLKEKAREIKEKNIVLSFQCDQNLPSVLGDYFFLKTVIETLIDNAIKYSREGGKIEVKISKKEREIFFEVKDNGLGIPKEEQKYIFQKFFRSSKVLEHQPKGSGLGLYLSKALIQRLGGKINFKSKEGEGSTFWFSLPQKL